MMRKFVLIALGACAVAIAAAPADAAAKSYWDQASGKWIKYDTNGAIGVGKRSFSPINRKIVDYNGQFPPNTIVINTSERRLYLIQAKGKAWKYGIGVGREGFQWAGTDWISAKAEWPGWTPPPEMVIRERAKGRILPAFMKGGPNNPLGARALYIGGTMYRIHGSNEPWTIGNAVSSGCIRLTNDDVTDLYSRVKVGTRVVVLRGDESPARLAALSHPPARKKAPDVQEARSKDDSPTDPATVGSTVPVATSVPADAVAPAGSVKVPAEANAPTEAPVKDDQVTATSSLPGATAAN